MMEMISRAEHERAVAQLQRQLDAANLGRVKRPHPRPFPTLPDGAYVMRGWVGRGWFDGDTLPVLLDMPLDIDDAERSIRLRGIDAPESETRDLVEKAAGIASAANLRAVLHEGAPLWLYTYKDTLARWVAIVWLVNPDGSLGLNLGRHQIDTGHAVPRLKGGAVEPAEVPA